MMEDNHKNIIAKKADLEINVEDGASAEEIVKTLQAKLVELVDKNAGYLKGYLALAKDAIKKRAEKEKEKQKKNTQTIPAETGSDGGGDGEA